MRGYHRDDVSVLRIQIFFHPVRYKYDFRVDIDKFYSTAQLNSIRFIHDSELRIIVNYPFLQKYTNVLLRNIHLPLCPKLPELLLCTTQPFIVINAKL